MEVLHTLKAQGVQLWVEGSQLRFRAPKGRFDEQTRVKVNALKPDIIAFLQQSEAAVATAIERAPARTSYPLSYAQQRMWFLAQYEGFGAVYHCPAAIALQGDISPARIEQVLNSLVARHASLRTRYLLQDGEPVQQVVPAVPVSLPLRHFSDTLDPVAAAQSRAIDLIQAPFDLQYGPLWRAELLKLSDSEHCLVWVIHHIATDGWSMGVLAREFAALYCALDEGYAAPLQPLPIEYVDYAVWQRRDIEQRVVPQQLPYWLERLRDAPKESALPCDYPRPPLRDGQGAVYRGELPQELTRLVDDCAQQHQATPFMVLLAAFKILLMRYSGQEDWVVGTPVANRPRPELANLVGYFVNTLALRSAPKRGRRFTDYLAELRNACVDAYAHQEVPFELLVERLGAVRDLSRTPLFQVMFSLQNAAQGINGANGRIQPQLNIAKFDLNVTLTLGAGLYKVECEYATALFASDSITRFFGHYCTLLTALLSDTQRRLGDYPLLTAAEQHQLQSLTDGSTTALDTLRPVHELFAQRAAMVGERSALRFRDETLSYAALEHEANQAAAQLRAAGLGVGDVAALALERSVELVVSLLAVLKCGASYLPVDPSLPPERVAFMLHDAAVRWAIAQQETVALFAQSEAKPLVWGASLHRGRAEKIAPAVTVPLDAIAYVIYTSGSTGMPKGVANQHHALCNRLAWMQRCHPIGPGDRVLQKTNYAFDVSVWEFLWPLIEGATLVLAEPGGQRDPVYLARLIAAEKISICHFVPSMLQQFIESADLDCLQSLRVVFASGEALPATTVKDFYDLKLTARLVNLYGPTEAAIDVSVWDCADTPARAGVVPIGRPIDNVALYVLDEDLQLQPQGVPGELYIGGIGLAAGYLGQSALTAERFIAHPFNCDSQRLYKTGDRARWLPDGTLEYLGRLDFQVKLRGLRIEIGEIEHQLCQHPDVAQCAVVVVPTPAGEPTLVAYITPRERMPEKVALRETLRRFLPEHMVPVRFETMTHMPLNANGKLDRKQLAGRPLVWVTAPASCLPTSTNERLVQEIWCNVLQLPNVGVEQNFFEIGGNSLAMVRVHQALVERLGREIPLVKLFAYPTVHSLAPFLDDPDTEVLRGAETIEKSRAGHQRLLQLRARRAQLNI